jgi:hypothetical protein
LQLSSIAGFVKEKKRKFRKLHWNFAKIDKKSSPLLWINIAILPKRIIIKRESLTFNKVCCDKGEDGHGLSGKKKIIAFAEEYGGSRR